MDIFSNQLYAEETTSVICPCKYHCNFYDNEIFWPCIFLQCHRGHFSQNTTSIRHPFIWFLHSPETKAQLREMPPFKNWDIVFMFLMLFFLWPYKGRSVSTQLLSGEIFIIKYFLIAWKTPSKKTIIKTNCTSYAICHLAKCDKTSHSCSEWSLF